MNKKKKFKFFIAVSLLLFSFLFLIPSSKAHAIVLEGALGTNSYVASANGDPMYVWMKNTSRYAATQTGNMSGKKQAYGGIPDGTYSYNVPSVISTYMGKTWYIDNAHTITTANFKWYMNGTNIENYSMYVAPY